MVQMLDDKNLSLVMRDAREMVNMLWRFYVNIY